MNRIIDYKNKKISYSVQGTGPSLVFLHGYLEYKELWSDFVLSFKQNYQIFCIDLPGHGDSESIGDIHTMKEMAQVVKLILDRNSVKQSVIIGHSMGGYVALAFADYFAEITTGLVLFSSSALNDSSEKKMARNRDIELIQNGKKALVVDSNIPKMFASKNRIRFNSKINEIKNKVKEMKDNAIIAALEGMKIRLNYQNLLDSSVIPILFIAGELDELIPIKVSEEQIKKESNGLSFKLLEESGHMGYLEEDKKAQSIISNFLLKIGF